MRILTANVFLLEDKRQLILHVVLLPRDFVALSCKQFNRCESPVAEVHACFSCKRYKTQLSGTGESRLFR